jgi:Flp pilus assembly protein TadD
LAEPAREPIPWVADFERDPSGAVDELLRGIADVAPYERAEPVDVLLMLFGGLSAEDRRRSALDGALSAWLSSRRKDDPERRRVYGMNRYVDELVQALVGVYRLLLPETAKLLRRDLSSFEIWLRSLYLGPGRDPAGELWRAMALTQSDRSLVEDWYRICEQARGALPGHWVDIGLLGLQRLPEPGGRTAAGTLGPEVLGGLFRWASRLPRGPVSRKAFQRRLATLMVLYPRAPKRWRELAQPLLERYPGAAFREWLEGAGLRLEKGAGRTSSFPALPPKHRRDRLLERLDREPAARLLPEIWSLVRDYERHAEATGETEFVSKTALNFSGRLRRSAPYEALRLARLAHRWEPSSPYCWSQWAEALKAIGDAARAEVVYWEAIRRFPENEVARNALAHLLAKSGRLEEAEALFRETMERFPETEVARNALADLLAKSGRSEEAETLLLETVKRFQEDDVARNALADLLAKSGHIERAEALLLETVKRSPKDDVARNALADLLARSGRRAEAERLYRETMKVFPGDRVAFQALAFWLLRWDRVAEAQDLYFQIRARFADDDYTRKLAEQLALSQEGWQGEIEAPDFSTREPERTVHEHDAPQIPSTVADGTRAEAESATELERAPGGDRGEKAAGEQARDELEPASQLAADEIAEPQSTHGRATSRREGESSDLEIASQLLSNAIVSRADLRLRSGENGAVRRQALADVVEVLAANQERVYPRLILSLYDAERRRLLVEQVEAFPHAYPLRFVAARETGTAEAWERLLGDFGEHAPITLLGRIASQNGGADPHDARRLARWVEGGNGSRRGFEAFAADRLRRWLGEAALETWGTELLRRLGEHREEVEILLGSALRRTADETVSGPS